MRNEACDMQFHEEELRLFLHQNKKRPIFIYDELDSTNLLAKRMLRFEPAGALILSESQTQGRGRMGRSFFSPRATGLYMSMELKPRRSAEKGVLITAMAAVAVSRALDSLYEIKTQIKWVNDIYVNGKKLCGILAEGELDENGILSRSVLGIGVNMVSPKDGFPPELCDIACALSQISEKKVTKSRLTAEIVNHFEALYDEKDNLNWMEEYRNKSCLIGREVSVISFADDRTRKARVLDIDNKARLVVQMEDGKEERLSTGDVSIVI